MPFRAMRITGASHAAPPAERIVRERMPPSARRRVQHGPTRFGLPAMTPSWPGFSDAHTLILPLDDAPPKAPLGIDGRRFAPKDELHATLVGGALGRELQAALGDRREAALRPAFEALDWSCARTGRGALIEKHGRRDDGTTGAVASIVEFVDLPALAHFHRWLGGLLGRQLPLPPPHVTLYTLGCATGIGIPTPAKLRAWCRGEVDLHALAEG